MEYSAWEMVLKMEYDVLEKVLVWNVLVVQRICVIV